MSSRIVIASHNIMHGRHLAALTQYHRGLRDDVGLDLLCLQENLPTKLGDHAHEIAAVLGKRYRVACSDTHSRQASIYDAEKLELLEEQMLPLARLASLNWVERLYIIGGRAEQKYGQQLVFKAAGGAPFTVVNVHLDAAGGNAHRARQMRRVAKVLASSGMASRAVVCGDTNAFSWLRRTDELRRVMRSVEVLGLSDEGSAPTHYFGRQCEPSLAARMCVLLGRLGIDLPRRYDVLYSSLPVTARGQLETMGSDHDLVWVAVDV